MKEVVEGSHAVSEAVRLARVQVMSAYPITPQTHIVEALSEYCSEGRMAGRFICVESEHSAMAAVIGAASGGVRTFTATSSHGLALMHELLHWSSAARLPIVMAEVNRALGPVWNIWMDQTDSLAQRDTGWIQLYCEDGQEVLDTTLMAFHLAEAASLPVMVVVDDLRAYGERVGVLKIRMFRPFPTDLLRDLVGHAGKIAVLDRNFCFGVGGIFAQEIRAALYHGESRPKVFSYIAGLGGRDVTPGTIEEIYTRTKQADRPETESVWVGLDPAACPVCKTA